MENVPEAIRRSEEELLRTRAALVEAREMVKSLEQDANDLELELTGLRSYARRRGLLPIGDESIAAVPTEDDVVVPISPMVTVAAVPEPDLLIHLSRNEAVATVLAGAAGPMNRTAIHEHCALGGRADSLDDISLSLTGLKRAGRVDKLGHGLWRLRDEPDHRRASRTTSSRL